MENKEDNVVDCNVPEAQELRQIVTSLERLASQKTAISLEESDILKNAKSRGFHPKVIKKIIAIRKIKQDERIEEEILLENYKKILGIP